MILHKSFVIVFSLCCISPVTVSAQSDSAVLESAKKYGRDMINWYFKKTTTIGHGGTDYPNAGSYYGARPAVCDRRPARNRRVYLGRDRASAVVERARYVNDRPAALSYTAECLFHNRLSGV